MIFLAGCGEVWNDPYPAAERGRGILYSSFADRPKHLDPVQSYTEDEAVFTQQVYEPLLQYHYLKRPYELIPLTAVEVPEARSIDGGKFTVYEISIRPGIRYQPHPGFVSENQKLTSKIVGDLKSPYDLPLGTRELTADDYIYQIKRLAHPRLHSPIYGLMAAYIVGLEDFSKELKQQKPDGWLDLRRHRLKGVERVDAYTFRVTLKGSYPQFVYWLAMPFFAPLPWEAEKFFEQPGMAEKNFTLDWWPVGSGPYMLTENNPNARMVLEKNPNFRGETYPSEGEAGDAEAGLLQDTGKTMPFVEKVVFSREKESIPYWNKFLQGYYDTSGIGSDQFDQAVRVSIEGDADVTPEMEAKGIRLSTSVETTVGYLAFNWDDAVVGGSSEKSRKLRHAVSIALDIEEQISIFANGRDATTGQPLVLYLDTVARGPGDKAAFDWYRRQFEKVNLQLEIRTTDWNRFQEKIRKGATQIFRLGWNADYPDPENFLFLLYGPQSRARHQGENAANYASKEYDALFEQMKNMPNSAQRQRIIDRMVEIARRDAPWVWGIHPKKYSLRHSWIGNDKPNTMARNNLKYLKLDGEKRAVLRREWNRPVIWPLIGILLFLAFAAVPAVLSYRRRERMAARPT